MDRSKVHPKTLEMLDKLPPEQRAIVEAFIAKRQTPEYRAEERALRERLDKEYRETGTISTRSIEEE